MMWASLSLLALVAVYTKALGYDSTSALIAQRFTEFNIYAVLPEPPQYLLTVIFGSYRLNLGNYIPLCATFFEPFTSFSKASSNDLYTLLALEVRARDNNGTQVRVKQLTVNTLGVNLANGTRVVPYLPTNVALGDGTYINIRCIFRQREAVEITPPLYTRYAITYYRSFNYTEFTDYFGVDAPLACNFYLAERRLCDSLCEPCRPNYNTGADNCPSPGLYITTTSTSTNSLGGSCF